MSAIAVGHEGGFVEGVEGEGENEFKSFVSYKLNVSPAKSFEGYAPPETDILRGEPSFRFIPSICEKAQNGCDERRTRCSRSSMHQGQCTEKLSIAVAIKAHGRGHPATHWRVRIPSISPHQHHLPFSVIVKMHFPPKGLQIVIIVHKTESSNSFLQP